MTFIRVYGVAQASWKTFLNTEDRKSECNRSYVFCTSKEYEALVRRFDKTPIIHSTLTKRGLYILRIKHNGKTYSPGCR